MHDVRHQVEDRLPERLPVLAVLGLNESGDYDWSRLRHRQYRYVAHRKHQRLAGHIAAAGAAMALFWSVLPIWVSLVWLAFMAISQAIYNFRDRTVTMGPKPSVTRREVEVHHLGAVTFALGWWQLTQQQLTLHSL